MEKTKVSTGIYWVEIPEASLYILCGCPADSVKHLMKRGLIVKKERKGVTYETGPNAILLSDVTLQNERFSNLAEFPVLQMFYRQGMMLPNHPNNTGIKPMLIGIEEEVKAQTEYIYRGNYGLVSLEEIMETGIPEDEAREMMRLKRRFAFDDIRKTEELLETRVVETEPVELRGGVFVHRKGVNLYEFTYRDTSVSVDLNLSGKEVYEAAYNLGFHKIKREYFSVVHSGEGDGWDVNRPCMSSIITFQGRIYLIDAGPNITYSLTALGISVNEIEGIFHTHAHDDHFNGLTVLMRSDHRIKHYSTPLVRSSIVKKLAALMSIDEDYFDKFFEIHDLSINKWNDIEGLEVMPLFSPHPLETTTMIFRTVWENGYRTYYHLADTVSFKVLEGMVTGDPGKSGVTREFFERVKKEYLVPVDLKKIDIGGGLIHGMAEDFTDDKSEKIILSHTEHPLTDSQKEIGASSAFGMEDVLIPAKQDHVMQSAYDFLSSYFDTARPHELRMLLNCPIVMYNPGSILLKKGVVSTHIYLVLNGVLEFIETESRIHNTLSSGSIVGELSGLMGVESRGTYRAESYVNILKIPAGLYREFVKRNNLYDEIRRMNDIRWFLQNTWLFGEMISCPIMNRIAREMESIAFAQGQLIAMEGCPALYLVREGEVEISSGGKRIEAIQPGGFFGEECLILEKPALLEARAAKDSIVCRIPGKLLENIPVIQWKMLETFERCMRTLETVFECEWRGEYSQGVREGIGL